MTLIISLIAALAPIILEVLKMIRGKPADEKKKIVEQVIKRQKDIREAIKKARTSGGDTADLERLFRG